MKRSPKLAVSGLIVAGLLAMRPGLAQTVTTTAGNGTPGFSGDNGPAASAQLDTAHGVATDSQGNTYLADSRNHRVRKIAGGIITTVAGTGQEGFSGDGGTATSAELSFPRAVAVDAAGNLYVADTGNCRIRRVTPAGVISTLAGNGTAGFAGDGGAAVSAQLSYPAALAIDADWNVYVADSWNYRIRKITADGKIQTVAGNGSYGPFGDGGPAAAASLGLIESLTVDAAGHLYLSDTYHHRVRKVIPGGSISAVVAGGFGPVSDERAALAATLKFPAGIVADAQGNLFVSDRINHRIRRVSPAGEISTAVGTGTPGYLGDGPAASALLNSPYGLAAGPGGRLVFSDLWNHRVRTLGGEEVARPVTPIIFSVLNTASGGLSSRGEVICPGAFVSIYGANLASRTADWSASIVNRQLPTELGGVSVSVGGKPAYIQYISPSQINILAPDVDPGPVQVRVTNLGATSAPLEARAGRYNPAFFVWGHLWMPYAVATHVDYSLCARPGLFPGASVTPAKPGEVIILWGTGFGKTDIPSGALTPADRAHVTAKTTVKVHEKDATVLGGAAVLAAGYAGLYQIAVQIPASTPDGYVRVQAEVSESNGMWRESSPSDVFLAVKR